jgi:hypothetical protein
MNKIHDAFAYLLTLLMGMYGKYSEGLDIEVAIEDVTIELDLNDEEVVELRRIHQGFISNF